jgi:signal transduction histidine kinase
MTNIFIGDPASRPEAEREAAISSPRTPADLAGDGGLQAISTDLLSPFAPVIMAVRWATTGMSLALASPDLPDGHPSLLIWTALILANTVLRTFRPLRYTASIRSLLALLGEIGLHVLAVIATGYWASPLILVLMNAVIVAGFARGFGFALRVGAASTLAVTLPGIGAPGWSTNGLAVSGQWATLIALSGIVAGYSRRISGEASHRHSLALDQVARLADANALLTDLHRVAQTMPASLDLGDVLDTTVARLRALLTHDAVAVLIVEPDDRWRVARQAATGLRGELTSDQLPAPARGALVAGRAVRSSFAGPDEHGLSSQSRSGIYVALLARGRLIGLLAVESRDLDAFSQREEQLLEGFVEPVALAVDNARWFQRIRTVGADEERTRIARDLHDRIGQSLAYLGFEVDRMIRHHDQGLDVGESLQQIRQDLRGLVGEVRDTLSDLRTDVTDNRGFVETASEFIERLALRRGLQVQLDCAPRRRLPILQEREMWRIAQEALVNVERHAKAGTAVLRWRCDDRGALLEVRDDGQGLPPSSDGGPIGRPDSYGIIGMRERADSIGATFEITSHPGEGTNVRCFLAHR